MGTAATCRSTRTWPSPPAAARAARCAGASPRRSANYHELLKTLDLGLEDRMTSKVGLLSGGQRQASRC